MIKVILYAEDDDDTATLYIKKLQRGNYVIKRAEDGQTAIMMYKKYSPDIILLDERMPQKSGYEVAEEIRKKDKRTPIIFLSSLEDENISTKCLRLGAIDFIRKSPERFEELMVKIDNAILNNPVKKDSAINITSDTIFDANSQTLTSFGDNNKLQFRDSNLLHILLINTGILVSRSLLMSHLWQDTDDAKEAMSKSISRLRKLMSADNKIQIITNRGESVMLLVG
jgi:Response regulators consisting of a CheY-like receiver domain and a winged-helix DNA-binding domain